jgi:predicted adenylyl cyclase CyaB
LEDLGFKEWVKKRKTVESYQYKKDKRIVIEINKVEHLGYYLEIEYLAKRSEVGKAKNKIRKVLNELEITKEQIDNVGYTKRLYDKGIRDKKYFLKAK